MAARGVNKVILVGNLGADPEVRTSPNGSSIANLRVATGEAWRDQQGQLQERTEWHRVVVFGRTAEIARDYLRKGSKIYLEGRIQTRKWQDKNGQDQYTTEIVAQEFQMLDRAGGEGQSMGGRPQSQASSRSNNDFDQSRGQTSDAGYPAAASGGGNDMDFDDDIPF